MNLNEDRKAPLRGKDLSTKREMVVQYISATAKSVSLKNNIKWFISNNVCGLKRVLNNRSRWAEVSRRSEQPSTMSLT